VYGFVKKERRATGKAHKKRRCLRSATVTVKSVFYIKVTALFTGKPPARVSHGSEEILPKFLRNLPSCAY
ncbi:MAG: hypothetical protein ACI4GB_06675, partial [Acutalibacteraceae bacterium]